METLPDEIIEQILEYPVLSLRDVINFSSTCSKYRETIIPNTSLWKIKYFQCWPYTDKHILVSNWYDECKRRKCFEQEALNLLSIMDLKFPNKDEKVISFSNLDFVVEFIETHKYGYHYLRDFLIELNSSSNVPVYKYNGSIVLKFIHKRHCAQLWHDLRRLNPKEKTLEKGAIFVSIQHHITERVAEKIVSELNQIASLVKKHLFQTHKDHPLKQIPEDVQLKWQEQNLGDNVFKPMFCVSIIDSINYVLFDQLQYSIFYGFQGIETADEIYFATSYRKASLLTFNVIYESIARRLGVQIEVLDFMDHCLLKWRESYSVEGAPFHYISVGEKGKFMRSRCPRQFGSKVLPCTMEEIAQKMIEKMEVFDLNQRSANCGSLQLFARTARAPIY